jgi:hypothetical protein
VARPANFENMKKKNLRVEETDIDPEDLNAGDTPSAQDVAQQAIMDKELTSAMAIEELMGSPEMESGQCRVTRKGITDADFVHLERVPVASMQPDLHDFIAKRYGGGKYLLWFHLSTGRFHAKKRLDIDHRVAEGEFFKEQRPVAAAGNGETGAISKLVDKIGGGNGSQDLLLTFLKMQQDQAAQMMNAQMQSTAQMLSAMSTMFAALKGGGEKPAFDMLQALTVFNQLKAKDSSVDPIKLMEMAHNWFRENQHDGEEESGWFKLVQALAPVLLGKMGAPMPAEMALRQLEQPPAVNGAQPAGPAAPPTAAPPQPAPEPEANIDPMNIPLLLKLYRPQLFAMIEAGRTPADVVDFLNNPVVMSDAQLDRIEAILRADTWKADLFGDMTLTDKQSAWFDEFRKIFLEPEPAP